MSISALGYLGLNVSNIEEWKRFAEDFLGLMPGEQSDDVLKYRCDDRAWRIALERGDQDDVAFVGFEAATPAALDEVRSRLEAHEIGFEEADDALKAARGVQDMVQLVDPSGLRVEVYRGPTELFEQPFRSPVGTTRFVTGSQGLGHVVLFTDKIEEMRRFYIEGLGFKLSDTISVNLGPNSDLLLEFYHCNSRHHTLAMVPVQNPKRMNHFMLEVASLDDVGFALDRLEACAVEMSSTLGKHTNDHMVSFYVSTPSGFEIEYGWGGRKIDDEDWRVVRHQSTSVWGHRRTA